MALNTHDKARDGSPTNDLRKTIAVASGETSEWFAFGSGVNQVNVDLKPDGTASIETTNDIDGAIEGTAEGIIWDAGEVSENTAQVATGVVAFRVVSASGIATAHFNAVRA